MATKQVGLGTLVKVDDDDSGTVFTTVGEVVTVTPSGRERELVDDTALADTLATYSPMAIETFASFTFRQFAHYADTNHAIIDTLFAAATATLRKVLWQLVYPYPTPVTDQFEGWVSNISPEEIARDGIISRTVTVQRTGAITRT